MLTLWGKEGYGWSPIVEAGKGVSTRATQRGPYRMPNKSSCFEPKDAPQEPAEVRKHGAGNAVITHVRASPHRTGTAGQPARPTGNYPRQLHIAGAVVGGTGSWQAGMHVQV
jgi:hypothetical protein